eukprot:9818987-Ditylum_brightwellii.AAC.1
MSDFNIVEDFACRWRCNKELIFKIDVNATTILAEDDSGIEISNDIAFICTVIEVSIKTLFRFIIKASVSSGHKEVICGDSKECFVIVVGLAENSSVICAHYHT